MRRTGRDIGAGATHTPAPRGGGRREGRGRRKRSAPRHGMPHVDGQSLDLARQRREASGSVDTSSKREHQHLSGEQTARAKQTGAARVRRTPGLSMARRLGGRCTVNSRSTHGQLNGQLTVNSTVNSAGHGTAPHWIYITKLQKKVLLKARQRGGRGGLAPLRQFILI